MEAFEEVPGLAVILTILHQLREVESTLGPSLVLMDVNVPSLSMVTRKVFLGTQDTFLLFFFLEDSLSVTKKGIIRRGAIEFLATSLNGDEALFAMAVLDTHGDLPEGDEIGVEAVLNAGFLAAQNLGTMLLKQLTEFLMEFGSLLKVGVKGRLNALHILNIDLVEETVNVFVVARDVVHLGPYHLWVKIFNFKLAIVFSKAMRVEVEGLIANHGVQALDCILLVALRVNLNVAHNLRPRVNHRGDYLAEVKNDLGCSVAEGLCKLLHELNSLLFGLREIFVAELLEVFNQILNFIAIYLEIKREFILILLSNPVTADNLLDG